MTADEREMNVVCVSVCVCCVRGCVSFIGTVCVCVQFVRIVIMCCYTCALLARACGCLSSVRVVQQCVNVGAYVCCQCVCGYTHIRAIGAGDEVFMIVCTRKQS